MIFFILLVHSISFCKLRVCKNTILRASAKWFGIMVSRYHGIFGITSVKKKSDFINDISYLLFIIYNNNNNILYNNNNQKKLPAVIPMIP